MTVFEENEGVIKILLFPLDFGHVKYYLCLAVRYEIYNKLCQLYNAQKGKNIRRRGEEAEEQQQQQQLCYQQEREQGHDQTPLKRFMQRHTQSIVMRH